MKPARPMNLDLTTIRFPLPAIASILHRISGVILFLSIPFALWILQQSLASPEDFDGVQAYFSTFWVKFIIWGVMSGLLYHLVAGIRHLLMDVGIGEELSSSRLGAKIVMGLGIVLSILIGVWLW